MTGVTGVVNRRASLAEVAAMLDWAAEEGWNPGLSDAAAFHAADPQGFFLAEAQGRPVAAISVVNHTDGQAFLGLYLCRPEHRGRGIGLALWRHALAHAGARSVGLDGVPAQEANYARSGFVLTGRTRRLGGDFAGLSGAGAGAFGGDAAFAGDALAQGGDTARLIELDAAANGYARPRYMAAWVSEGPDRKTVVQRDGGAVTGFATVRRCRAGLKIGPVIALDAGAALGLATRAAGVLGGGAVSIDVPDSSAEFGALLRAAGFVETFATARMYRGPAPQQDRSLQAVATLELG